MKKLILSTILTSSIISSAAPLSQSVASAKVGDVIGTAYNTDIVAYINNYAIPSYAVNGTSCIVAEDLRNFGCTVDWNNAERALYITRDNSVVECSEMSFEKIGIPGSVFSNILETDIKVYAAGSQISSYALNGYTMIPIEELTMLGECNWVQEQRAIKLWIDGLGIRSEMQPVVQYSGSVNQYITTASQAPYQKMINGIISAGVYFQGNYIIDENTANFDIFIAYNPSKQSVSFVYTSSDSDPIKAYLFLYADSEPMASINVFGGRKLSGYYSDSSHRFTTMTNSLNNYEEATVRKLFNTIIKTFENVLYLYGVDVPFSDVGVIYETN